MSAGSKARPWPAAPVPWALAARFRSGAWAGYRSISRAGAPGCLVSAPHRPRAVVATTTSGSLERGEWFSEVSLLEELVHIHTRLNLTYHLLYEVYCYEAVPFVSSLKRTFASAAIPSFANSVTIRR